MDAQELTNLDLLQACCSSNEQGILDALNRGANPNCHGPAGNTPLIMLSMYRGDAYLADLLISKGANPGIQNSRGRDAYFTAVGANNFSIVDYLDAKKLNTELRDANGIRCSAEVSRMRSERSVQ